MILEAFAEYLHAQDSRIPAPWALSAWLYERLSAPAETTADKVLHCEISLCVPGKSYRGCLKMPFSQDGGVHSFKGRSESGKRLLNSLYQYALSYEQQKWARWVHFVKASDFNQRHNGSA